MRGVKTALLPRGQPSSSPKSVPLLKKDLTKRVSPVYAEEGVCRQFDIEAAVKPSDAELDDIVMYGELAQARHHKIMRAYA